MLAHELTHVVQQRSGPVDGTDAGGGVKVSDPSDRFEREAVANADRVMSAAPVAAPAAAGPAVQRCADGDDHAHAQTYVQRTEEAPEEETAQTYVQRAEAGAEETPEEETAQTYVQRQESGEEEEEAPAA
jgi:hypothetical protein